MEIVETKAFVADAVERIAKASVEARGGPFRLSLCGGSTPKAIYAELAKEELAWDHFVITFGDERCVPPDHADSNYRMAKEALLDQVPIPEANVLRLRGELSADEAARICEGDLRRRSPDEVFAHDLVLLGMGEDGHTASLFPGTEALTETGRWVAPNKVPQLNTTRITMTYPLINAARRVLFLVSGAKKRAILDEIRTGQGDYPAGKVKPAGDLVWLVGE
jgi:6-phosphogluconolactonase